MNKNTLQETYKMTVEILTPVSISDNKKLNAKEYLYCPKEKTVYFLNQFLWHKFIYTHNLLEEYEKYMTDKYEKKNLYEWFQSRGYDIKDIQEAIMAKAAAHTNLAKQTDKRTLNDIICQMRMINGTPYIPGSSLKGVIRTAILYNLLKENEKIRSKYWHEANEKLSTSRGKRNINNDIGKITAQLETELLHKLKLYNSNDDKPLKSGNAVCSVMRGISVGDSEYTAKIIPTAILQKVDLSLFHGNVKSRDLPVFRECVLPKTVFNFQLKLDKTMTAKIGINSVDDLLDMLQFYFDFVNKILKNAFGRECISLFEEINEGNIYLGSNTGFLSKTIVAALAPEANKKEAVNFVRNILDINFTGKNAHNGKNDTVISPRTLKATRYNGKIMLTGVGKITVC